MAKIRPDRLEIKDLISEILILLNGKKKILILEGKSDISFFKVLTNELESNNILFYNAEGKENILLLFNRIPNIKDNPKIVGVIDKDLESIMNTMHFNNLFETDFADLDNYYFHLKSFGNFLREFMDDERVSKALEFNPLDPSLMRSHIIDGAKYLTQFRVINTKFKIPLGRIFVSSPEEERKKRFKKISKTLSPKMKIDCDKLFRYLWTTGECLKLDIHEVKENFEQTDLKIDDINYITNGHDMISILTCITNLGEKSMNDVEVEKLLRLPMNANMFAEFDCLKKVSNWILNIKDEYNSQCEVAASSAS